MTLKNVLVLHGPNLNLLGERPGDDRGLTLDALNHQLQQRASELGLELRILQSNHEGELIDKLHAERRWLDGVVISPDTLAHTSYPLREAIAAVGKPAVEVHLSDIRRRESWRRKSVIKDVCDAQVVGKGAGSYLIALEKLGAGTGGKKRGKAATPVSAGRAKTLGRADSSEESGAESRPGAAKTLGRASSQDASNSGKPSGSKAPATSALSAKTIGREPPVAPERAPATREGSGKSIGRREAPESALHARGGRAADFLTRALVRQKISERLAGKLTAGGLAAWARAEWNKVQEGAAAEVGHRDELEEALQTLTLSTMAASRITDEQLVELMAQLEG